MRAVTFLFTLCVSAAAAAAQARPVMSRAAGLKPSDVAGTWTLQNNVKNAAGQDTVVSSELSVSPDAKTWVTHLAGRDPVPTRVVAMGGDSVVTESGPFKSVARAGQTVLTRETFHFKGNDAWGTIEARYSNHAVVKGTIKGTRKK